ncbi:MAG: DUF192 domain-containing protein [Candidatus Dormiibacterota bacterium]
MPDQRVTGSAGPVVVRTADGSLVAGEVAVADRFGTRLMGLMGRTSLQSGEGLWLLPCKNVHMFFMRMRLDIVYLDRQLRVVLCVPEMREWRVRWLPVRQAHSVLELAPGSIRRCGIREGDVLEIKAELGLLAEAAPRQSGPVASGVQLQHQGVINESSAY